MERALRNHAHSLKLDDMFVYAHTHAAADYYASTNATPSQVRFTKSPKWPVHIVKDKQTNGKITSVKIIADFEDDEEAAELVAQINTFRFVMGNAVAAATVALAITSDAVPQPYVVITQVWGKSIVGIGGIGLYRDYCRFILECVIVCIKNRIFFSDCKTSNTVRCKTTGHLKLIDIDSEGKPYGKRLDEITHHELVLLDAQTNRKFVRKHGTPPAAARKDERIEWYFRRLKTNLRTQMLVFVSAINKAAYYMCNKQVETDHDALTRIASMDITHASAASLCRAVTEEYVARVQIRTRAQKRESSADTTIDGRKRIKNTTH